MKWKKLRVASLLQIMKQAIALAVLRATPVSSMVAWGKRVIPQRNEAFLFKSIFQGIWSLGLLLLGQRRASLAKNFQLSSIRVLWTYLLQPRENLKNSFYCFKDFAWNQFLLGCGEIFEKLKCLNKSLHETNKSKFTSNFHNWHVFGVIKRDNSDPLQEKYIII